MPPKLTAQYLASQGLSVTAPFRFWKKVDKNGPIPEHCQELGPCWMWTAHKFGPGYGWMNPGVGKRSKRGISAHRASWIINCGPIPEGDGVLHKCDNHGCVRPDHLFTGDDSVNGKDFSQKHRWCGGRKLNLADAKTIRELRATGKSEKALAKSFGVNRSQINRIVNGVRWRFDYYRCV